jgi:hypothetical protein
MQQPLVKLNTTAIQTVITFTATENRRETYIHGGWNILDDEAPLPPEVDSMASAQSRRFWAQLTKADGPQSQFHGAAIPNDWPKRASAAAPEVMAG